MKIIKAKALKSKDKIAIVAPASPFSRDRFDKGLELLDNMGFKPVYDDSIFSTENYLAGTDTRRLAELMRYIEDPDIKAIMAVRGGYGSMRLFSELNFRKIAQNPKIWMGFSDISALNAAIYCKTGLITIHGPQLVSLPDASNEVRTHWLNLVCDKTKTGEIFSGKSETLVEGFAEGRIITINLAMLCSLLATPYLPDLTGHILAIEDVGEWPYRLDRMLTQLELAGIFKKINGLVLGQFTFPENAPQNSPQQLRQRIEELASKHQLPTIANCPFGHIDDNYALASGVKVTLDATSGKLIQNKAAIS